MSLSDSILENRQDLLCKHRFVFSWAIYATFWSLGFNYKMI